MIFRLTDKQDKNKDYIGKIDFFLNAYIFDSYIDEFVEVEETNKFINLGVLLLAVVLYLGLKVLKGERLKFSCNFYNEKSFNRYLLMEKLQK